MCACVREEVFPGAVNRVGGGARVIGDIPYQFDGSTNLIDTQTKGGCCHGYAGNIAKTGIAL